MNQIKTIFKNVSWVTLSQIVTNVFAFFWTILIARYLGVTQYGILSFVLSLVMIIGIGEDIGITTYTTRELARNRSLTQKFINNILPIKLILSLILLVLTIFSLHLLGYDLLTLELTFIIFFETIFLTNANFLSGVFQAHENLKPSSIGSIICSSVLLTSTVIVVIFDLGVVCIAISVSDILSIESPRKISCFLFFCSII